MFAKLKKIFGVGLEKISPKVKEWLQLRLTDLMDFLERHFNNIVKHLFGIGGAGLGLGLVTNMTNVVIDGALEKFSFFSRVLGIRALFENLDSVLTPYMSSFSDTSFIGAFAAFGGVEAINIIVNSCAYALLFWLAVVVFKYTIGLIPLLLRLIA
jgi:hypothetical protein